MSGRIKRLAGITTPDSAPSYELRTRRHGPSDTEIEVWQLPSPASPQLPSPVRLAGLRGRNLELVEHRVLRRLSQAGIKFSGQESQRKEGHRVTEDLALMLGLFVPHPRPNAISGEHAGSRGGIEAMGREEAPTGSVWQCTAATHGAC